MAGPDNTRTLSFLSCGATTHTVDSSASAILNGMPIKDDVIPLSQSAMKLPRKALKKTAFVLIRCSACPPSPSSSEKTSFSEAFSLFLLLGQSS